MQSGRKAFVGGNWKCNKTLAQAKTLIQDVVDKLQFDPEKVDVIVAPIYLHLFTVMYSKKNQNVQVAAQNCSKFKNGAYTGEVSAEQLKDLNVEWVIIGHSERRQHFKQTNEDLAKKVQLVLQNEMKVIYCFGETKEQRSSQKTQQIIKGQLEQIIDLVDNRKQWDKIVLAYEPVWAIGTGLNATNDQVKDAHGYIRGLLSQKNQQTISVRIIYGGSVTAKNCNQLINVQNVDGFLVGGASLKQDFIQIVNSASNKK